MDASGRQPPPPAAADASVLRIGLSGVQSIDPVAASPGSIADVFLVDLFYDGLTTVDPDGAVVPSIADFAVNADGTVWRFTIREDSTFADGSSITPEDVVTSMQRVQGRGARSLAALRLDNVTDIAVAGDRAVDFTLEAPSAVLPELLSSPLYPITDDETIERYLAGGDQTPNASGDHTVVLDGSRFVLERRRGSGPETVVVDLFDDDSAALDTFLDGGLDWVVAPPERLGDALAASGPDSLVPFHGGLFLGIDGAVRPLDDPRLRRAIALAIDRTAVVGAVFGPAAQPLLGIVPVGVPGGATECIGPCGPEVGEAARLVREVYPDGQSSPLRILVDDSASQVAVGGIIEEQLEAAGLVVEVSSLDVETYESLITTGQQQMFLFGSLGIGLTPASHLPPLFTSTSPDNVMGFENPNIDAALVAARSQQIALLRTKAWRDVELAILDAVPVVPLVQFRTTGVSSPRLSGFVVRADGSLDLRNTVLVESDDG